MILGPLGQRGVDPMVYRRGLAVDALSVDAQQHLHTMPGPGRVACKVAAIGQTAVQEDNRVVAEQAQINDVNLWFDRQGDGARGPRVTDVGGRSDFAHHEGELSR
jgi:hypothetical protein